MNTLALLTAGTLAVLGLIHIYWACGGKRGIKMAVPAFDGQPAFRPGAALTFLVALVLFAMAATALLLRWPVNGVAGWIPYAGWSLAGLFLLRAVGEFKLVGFFKKVKGTPFARWDTLLFSPLCLGLAAAFALLAR